MPRRPIVVPVTTAFRVAAPDTLRQVLLYATTSTLAACLRVSQNFYHVAAPILYQDVEFFNNGTSFLEGALVKPRAVATRSAPRVDNFKVPLLSNIKTLTVNFQKARKGGRPEVDLQTNYHLARLPPIETLRLKFHDLGFCTRCQAYNCDFRYRYTHMDQMVLRTKFKKLVLLPSAIHWQHHSRWPCASAGLEALTIVVNSHEIPLALGSAIGHLARNLAVKLRLVIFSRSVHAKRSPPGHSENMGGARAPSVLETSIAKTVYHSTKECSAETEVYLVEARSKTTYGSSHPEALPSKVCAQELFRAYEAKQLRLSGSPKDLRANVVFKNRKDYLLEDVTDEIDAEELVRWKRAQDWEDQASFYDQYHPVILDERRREYDRYTNHLETIQEAQLIQEYQNHPDILLQDWVDRCVRAEELSEWIDEEVTMTLVEELV